MGQFSTDFSDYSINEDILDSHPDWRLEATDVSDPPQIGDCIVISATSPLQGVDRYLRCDSNAGPWSIGNYFFTYLPAGADTESDFDVVWLCRRDSAQTIASFARGRHLSTTTNFQNQGAYYRLQERSDSTQRLRRLVTGASSTLSAVDPKGHGMNWFWSRVQVRGTAIKGATWLADPGTPDGGFGDFPGWDHEATNSDITGAGFAGFQLGRVSLFDTAYIGIGTATDDAPAPGTGPEPPWVLTVNVNGQGSAIKNPDQADYADETDVDVTAIPDSGWTYANPLWTGPGVPTGDENLNPVTIHMDANKSITANFEELVLEEAVRRVRWDGAWTPLAGGE